MSNTSISPSSGGLAIAALTAAVALGAVTAITPPVGSLAAAGIAGTVAQVTVTAIAPTVGSLALAGLAPGRTSQTVTAIAPTVGSLAAAGIAGTVAQATGPSVSTEVPGESGTVVWPSLANGAVGAVYPRMRYRAASFQAAGVFGAGGSVKLQGSNDGAAWADLTPAALTGAGLFVGLAASERPKYIRPNVTAGDATTSITVTGWFS